MRPIWLAGAVVGLTLAASSIALGATRHGYHPRAGFVPDSETAVAIAEAVLKPVYGEKLIRSERPFHATLRGDVWTVRGYIPPNYVGGTGVVKIDKRSGAILFMIHEL